jgi:site-specific recombinase XerD
VSIAEVLPEPWIPKNESHREWALLSVQAPQLAATMRRYLVQLTTFLAPRSVDVADSTLRQLARWLVAETDVVTVAGITRRQVEDYKVWLASQPGCKGPTLAKNTQRQRLKMIRIFLERLIEWDWPEAHHRNPILHGDIPPRPEPLPKFLSDEDSAKLLAAAKAHRLLRYRLVVEMLSRTGMRATELCELAADAVSVRDGSHWLRIPVGKLRNDRMIPLHAELVPLLDEWTTRNRVHIRAQQRLMADEHKPLDRRTVHRIVATTAKKAGIEHAYPHQLRHTLATQAINRGMRLETIAEMLGHRSMDMTLVYARIANRVVADEYASVMEQVDALYTTAGTSTEAPFTGETPAMTRLRTEYARMLGNGMCTRPADLDCRIESACERCAYFQTGPENVPVLIRQRNHAREHGQTNREMLFESLVNRATEESA